MKLKLSLIGMALAFSQTLFAQTGPVRLVVGFPPGGSADTTARLLADKMKDTLGVSVLVENKPGAGGRIAAQMIKEAAPDGNTVMVVPFAVMVVQPMVFKSIKYDTTKDFTPIGNATTFPLALAAGPGTPAKDMKELITWFKANPGKANFGSPAAGSMPHFMGEMLADAAKIKLTHVAYQGGAPLVNDLLGGHVPSAISLMDGMMAHHRAGKIRVIGIFTKERSALMPDIPTFSEQGIDVTSGEGWTGIWARAGTPAAEIERMQKAVQQVLQMPEVKEQMTQRLWVQPHYRNGAEMDALQRAELAHWEPIIKASGFKPE